MRVRLWIGCALWLRPHTTEQALLPRGWTAVLWGVLCLLVANLGAYITSTTALMSMGPPASEMVSWNWRMFLTHTVPAHFLLAIRWAVLAGVASGIWGLLLDRRRVKGLLACAIFLAGMRVIIPFSVVGFIIPLVAANAHGELWLIIDSAAAHGMVFLVAAFSMSQLIELDRKRANTHQAELHSQQIPSEHQK